MNHIVMNSAVEQCGPVGLGLMAMLFSLKERGLSFKCIELVLLALYISHVPGIVFGCLDLKSISEQNSHSSTLTKLTYIE